MSAATYRPLDVVEAMEATGIPKDLVDKFDEATETVSAVSLEAMVEHMKVAGLDLGQRRAVKHLLQDGPMPPRPHTAPVSPTSPGHHEPAPLPLIPFSDLKDMTRLGSGAFGDVYKGTYHGAEVAVKKAGVFARDVSSIEKERRTLGSIKAHPNLVHVLGVCVDDPDGAVRIVMELCPGGDLVGYMETLSKPLSMEFVLTVFYQAGHGVGHLHATPPGICHRDIRRANLLVASRDPLRICLADFGLSHVLHADGPSTTDTKLGPTAWRAPETFIAVGGQQEVSVKTDVYMFGCFMLEVVTGKEPLHWVGSGEAQLLLRMRDFAKSPLDLAEAAGMLDVSGVCNDPKVPGTVNDVMALIRQCLAAEPKDRPNMAHVTAALKVMRGQTPPAVTHLGYVGFPDPATPSPAVDPTLTVSGDAEFGAQAVEAEAIDVTYATSTQAMLELECDFKFYAQASAASDSDWTCSVCTLRNDLTAGSCVACGASKDTVAATPPPATVATAEAAGTDSKAGAFKLEPEAPAAAGDVKSEVVVVREASSPPGQAAAVAPPPQATAVAPVRTGLDVSVILATVAPERLAAFLRALADWLPRRAYTLLYRGTRDGMTPAAFHRLCDSKGPTLVIVQCNKGWVFGGFAGVGWFSPPPAVGAVLVHSADSFVFSVTGPFTAAPVRFPVLPSWAHQALRSHGGRGPVFNGGFWVRTDSKRPFSTFSSGSSCQIGLGYKDVLGKGTASLTGAVEYLPVEVEVFAVGTSPA